MSERVVFPVWAQLGRATAGRNRTKAAYVGVGAGVVMMVLLTVDPAYEAAHHWVDAVLWACLAFFVFEWVVRLRHAYRIERLWAYTTSLRGLVDAAAAAAVPLAFILGANPKSAWLLGICCMFKLVPGIPGLRLLRPLLAPDSRPPLRLL